MRPLTLSFLLIGSVTLSGDGGAENKAYTYPRLKETVEYTPYYHVVRPNESLSVIAWGYYGYLAPMIREETGMNKTEFLQALTERVARENEMPVEQFHKLTIGQTLLMPPINPDNCTTLISNEDWTKIDRASQPPTRPVARPVVRPQARPENI